MKLLLVLLLVISSSSSFAYNWRRCKASMFKPSKTSKRAITGNIGEDLWATTSESSTNSTLDKTIGGIGSTTSYVSSTGACKAIGMAHEERTRYIAGTQNELQLEIAEGKGEHANALASLFGCNEIGKKNFVGIIRSRHSDVFSARTMNSPELITGEMVEAVANSPTLSAHCNPEII